MKRERIEEGRFSDRGEGLGTVTEEMVRQRAGQIAVINGRDEQSVNQSDLDQARRELTGEGTSETAEDRIPEGERWDPVPGSVGHKAPTVPSPDEQTFAEKLTDEGVSDAEHDQEIEATEERRRRETRP